MTIAILPARLANQIAAGEVVERPASVVKELVENSIDAGASTIKIDIEKGGAKRIRITDNGQGIAQAELALALSRHATSKIKDLDDLEAISSLGFRGEALASISSVARLTLTSKPAAQASAWQASAEGRDMAVSVKPAAHPDGTTIDVSDLFFNTPARRKFLRTEKTEFNHIEEVIKRIALAHFEISFVLSHNHKVVKQYRAANTSAQRSKRIAQVCGQKFIDHALEIDCQHDGLHLYGWIAQPSFYRAQNDLCYSYVNERMMRDKLINHAIRQAYADLLPSDSYPAFVLFLKLDFREVDVNVHPAKHEVRFHQGRYVHDFIYSVCHRALKNELAINIDHGTGEILAPDHNQAQVSEPERNFITPLQRHNRQASADAQPRIDTSNRAVKSHYTQAAPSVRAQVTPLASKAYSDLMTPLALEQASVASMQTPVATRSAETTVHTEQPVANEVSEPIRFLCWQAPAQLLFLQQEELRLLSLKQLDFLLRLDKIKQEWQTEFVSQPLLLPVKIAVTENVLNFVENNEGYFQHLGIQLRRLDRNHVQIRQFPALLRNQDINLSFTKLISLLRVEQRADATTITDWQQAFAALLYQEVTSQAQALEIWQQAKNHFKCQFPQQLRLNSVVVDLTSAINQLKQNSIFENSRA
ncbi:DNA mismatch repair protein MutL [Colwellia chukchiensis]|uniref:DNA mismatch repair protein MutL n=1 Tax=Colwellia chukchiensis TaxID=641665 RepID=A0A1H7T889_9GAMM|nr:DNA mismatch repair endonuclease MutL [Colwellia chukchiensis]SEL81111.1 DNA mismatch repair protein MutL [Colwellia chukchiensis]